MYNVVFVVQIFLILFFVQLIVLRIIAKARIHPFISFFVYLVGLPIVVYKVSHVSELPYTAILVYILFTLLLVTFSFVPLLSQRSPSSIILSKLQSKSITVQQLYDDFDEKNMVLGRVEDLVRMGLAYKQGPKYALSSKGIFIARLVSVARSLMGLKIRG